MTPVRGPRWPYLLPPIQGSVHSQCLAARGVSMNSYLRMASLAAALLWAAPENSNAAVVNADFTVLPDAWVQAGLVPPFSLQDQPTFTGQVIFTTDHISALIT